MKKLLLILLCLPLMTLAQQTWSETYVPDDNFEAYLENNGMGNGIANDDSVLTSAINTVTYLYVGPVVGNLNIADLTGIEDFTALTELNCDDNQLTTLDVSQNTALTKLHCDGNQLTSLDVSNNTALTILNCGYWTGNQLTSLDVSNNTALTELFCGGNQLTTLDVSQNTNLDRLVCQFNNLTSLDLSSNTALTVLICSFNDLLSLDLSNNTALTHLYARDNNLLTNINLSTVNACWFTCEVNPNPNLVCINVDDAACIVGQNASWNAPIGWCRFIDGWGVWGSTGLSMYQISSSGGSCASAMGCTDQIACNYDAFASIDDGSCNYNSSSYDTLSITASIVWNGIPLNISGDYSVTLVNSVGCDSIVNLNLTINPSGILNIANTEKILFKITDMLGQETLYRRNTLLFYIYDDGTVEKRITIE